MLAYFAFGNREYDKKRPLHANRRFWEFQAVMSGRIAQLAYGEEPGAQALKSSALWISPPGASHSWVGAAREHAEIVVFHFTHIPETLLAKLPDDRTTVIPLSEGHIERLREIAISVDRYWKHPSTGMLLCYDYARATICHLAYEALVLERSEDERRSVEERVEKALIEYQSRMATNPSLTEIAEKVHCSPTHLRRLFYQTYMSSPKKLFDQLRFQRAVQLLTETNQSLAAIAEQCGFQEQSAFSRAFKHQFRCCPSAMRMNQSSGF